MSDIVERLRTRNGRPDGFGLGPVCDEAADEIERLRAERTVLLHAVEKWRSSNATKAAELHAAIDVMMGPT